MWSSEGRKKNIAGKKEGEDILSVISLQGGLSSASEKGDRNRADKLPGRESLKKKGKLGC